MKNTWTENEIRIREKPSEDEQVKKKFKRLSKKGITEPRFYLIVLNMN